MRIPRSPALSTLLLAITLGIVTPGAAHGQAGYRFTPPNGTLSFRIGAGAPSAQDELFDFFTEELTLDRGDFLTAAVAADFAVRIMPQLDFVIGVAHDGSSTRSEFREWVDQDDQPIEQTTEFTRTPLTVSAKYYVLPPGRSLATHAWVPATFTPYLTVGGGYMFYSLKQKGDFVDFETLDVFTRRFDSRGGGPIVHAGAGGEWWFTPHLGLSLDGRYAWGSASLERDFEDFDRIDMRGFQITTGVALRF